MTSDLAGTKGGSGVWQRIISEMPAHRVYIEAYWGRGTIADKKLASETTIGCDLDPKAIDHGRRSGATMYKIDAVEFLKGYFRIKNGRMPKRYSDVFVYLDPPYWGVENYYGQYGMEEKDHRNLLELFLCLPCPAALSGYHSSLYEEYLHGKTRVIEIPTVNRAGGKCVEVLWMNYEPPTRYHDTRVMGEGRRERERIKRRRTNWKNGLKRMPTAERQAVWEALADEFDVTAWPAAKLLPKVATKR